MQRSSWPWKAFFIGENMPAAEKKKQKSKYTFAIIGTGMVGTAIGILLKKAGYQIAAVYDKSPAALKKAVKYTKARAVRDPLATLNYANCLLLTTPDDAIAAACREIADASDIRGKFVFHLSGAGGLDLLDAAAEKGACVGSFHPLQSFSSVENAVKNIPGSYFGVTAEGKSKALTKKIVADLKGIPLFIADEQKPLYHAAACFVSNYLVTLLNSAEAVYQTTGISEKQARRAYLPLVWGTLKNIERCGSVSALTGPIARGDAGTIKKHLQTIEKNASPFSDIYRSLGMLTIELAVKKGTLSLERAQLIKKILKGE